MNNTLLNNRYRLIKAIGEGGFGETFLAEDTQMPSGRQCVVKKLKPIANNPQIYQLIQERFKREATILEKLGDDHRQIPRLYAYFSEGSYFYLVEELIRGDTLKKQVESFGVFSESTVRHFLVNILPVFQFIHRQKIVHRDIKPDNIILRNTDRLPVLIDFGAVKEAMGTELTHSGNATHSIVIGTPGFMAAEQATGKPVYSSDLYSLGLTAIYLLTGKFPQELETDSRTGQIIWRSQTPHISSSLAKVLDKAIEFHPRDRYPNAQEMLAALQQPKSKTISPVASTIASSARVKTGNPQPPSSGEKGWRNAAITGGVIGIFAVIDLLIAPPDHIPFLSPSPEQSPTQPTPSPTPTNSPTAATTPEIDATSNSLKPASPNPSPSIPLQPSNRPIYQVTHVEMDDTLYVHSKADVNDKIVGCLPPDGTDIFEIGNPVTLADGGVWQQIQYKGITGWVNRYYLEKQVQASGSGISDANLSRISPQKYRVFNVEIDDVLYVLYGPGVDNKIVGCIPPEGRKISIIGDSVTVENGAVWVPIEYRQIVGWVNSRYLAKE